MTRISFSRHAIEQMQERNIGREAIHKVLAHPEYRRTQMDGLIRAMDFITRRAKRYLLIVVYRDSENEKRIVTVFLTSKIHKYLSRQ